MLNSTSVAAGFLRPKKSVDRSSSGQRNGRSVPRREHSQEGKALLRCLGTAVEPREPCIETGESQTLNKKHWPCVLLLTSGLLEQNWPCVENAKEMKLMYISEMQLQTLKENRVNVFYKHPFRPSQCASNIANASTYARQLLDPLHQGAGMNHLSLNAIEICLPGTWWQSEDSLQFASGALPPTSRNSKQTIIQSM